MRRRTSLSAAALALALVVGGCGGSDDASDDATTTEAPTDETTTTEAPEVEVPEGAVETDQVTIADLAFGPEVIVVQAGTTVRFANEDTEAHTITHDDGEFQTGAIPPGESLGLPFPEPGTYTYHCEIHPAMTGTVVVTP